LIVDVQGEVKSPGVYELPMNSRVNDALKAAGGALNSADLSYLNQARLIKDGEQIFVDRKISGSVKRTRSIAVNGILNLNRASAKELEKLPGIGPVLASRIIEYRKINGNFQSIDELGKVQGIGASTLEKFKSKIRV
jgi:competence protein ComEA